MKKMISKEIQPENELITEDEDFWIFFWYFGTRAASLFAAIARPFPDMNTPRKIKHNNETNILE